MKKFFLLTACLIACLALNAQDTKVAIASATATSEQGGEDASMAIDGNLSTFWHSQWGSGAVFNSVESVEFTITLKEVSLVDYVRYIPRQNHSNGHWGEVDVYYSSSKSGIDFTKVGTFSLTQQGLAHDFYLNGVNCGQIKFTIRSGNNNHATAAEIEAYQINNEKADVFEEYFNDVLCTEPKSGVNGDAIEDADVKDLVKSLQGANVDAYKKFRVGEYKPYMTLASVQKLLGNKNPYSKYENPTGVYFTQDQTYWVAVSGIDNDPVNLTIKNWLTDESSCNYPLRNGLNCIKAKSDGNVFVSYYTDNAEAENVKIHFINAPVLGYWDKETMTNDDWKALLAGKNVEDKTILMVQSEHVQLAYPISAWLTHCPEKVTELMTLYEDVQWAQRDIMGLEKYNKTVENRQFFYATNYGFMAAGEEGAYCHVNSLGAIMNPDAKSFDFWGVGHEWGHNNQIPGFHWSGCGETTNNIYASWGQIHAQLEYNGKPYNLRLEDEVTGINEYSGMRGGRMQAYFEEGLRKGFAWQLQEGPDDFNDTPVTTEVDEYDADGKKTGNKVPSNSRKYDPFVMLAPFWQLNLWGTLAGKCPDIIPMVIESIRTTENYTTTYNTNGKQQVNWMKLACDNAQLNLLPFFEKAGMLRPIKAYINDYSAGWNIINEKMINDLKAYVEEQGYPTPKEEINYINGHNYMVYRDRLKLQVPTAFRTGCKRNGNYVTVQHSAVQNAVAFETYNSSDELVRITMYGLGSDADHSYTQVLFPQDEGANYIMAVGYNGTRKRIYDTRTNLNQELKQQLATLIGEAESLINTCGEVTHTPAVLGAQLELQTTSPNGNWYVSSNADQNTGGGETDGEGIAALVDNSSETYFHTRWGGTVVNEPHYIQVDMGKEKTIQNFMFTYTARQQSPAPTEMTIYGSNDGTSFTDVIKSINYDWADYNNNGTYTSAIIEAGKAYRYLRFTVTKSNGPGNEQYGGYYFFGMKEFDLTPVTPDQYSVSLNPAVGSSVTVEQLIDVCRHKTAAQVVSGKDSPTEVELQEAINNLQASCDVIYKYLLPVTLTTDIENPVLYVINSKRGEDKVLQYDPADEHTFSIVDKVDGSVKQAFFFMEGDKATQVYVYPFVAGEQVLSANETSGGARKVFAKAMGDNAHEQWQFVKLTAEGVDVDYYGLQSVGTNVYFSHHGGGGNKMGFYTVLDDLGTLFTFTPTTIEGSAAYSSLRIYYDEVAKVASSSIVGGNNPYYYPVAQANAYNIAYADATARLAGEIDTEDYDNYLAAYKNLLAANENEDFTLKMPAADKFYRIVSADITNGRAGGVVYANPAHNKMYWANDKEESDATAIWTIVPSATEGKFNVANLHTGTYISEFINYNPSPLSETAGDVVIESISCDGQVKVKSNEKTMHAQGGGAVVNWNTGINDASAWRIEEVSVADVKHTLTVTEAGWASLVLGFNATMPANVKAYIVSGVNNSKATLEDVNVEVLPANTPVLVEAAEGSYEFAYTTEPATAVEGNLLQGKPYVTYLATVEGTTNYVLSYQGEGTKVLGFYKKTVLDADLSDDDEEKDDEGKVITPVNDHIAFFANKAYLPVTTSNGAAPMLRISRGDDATGIQDAELTIDNGQLTIYDITGRRVEKMEKGIYIVNGRKVVIK